MDNILEKIHKAAVQFLTPLTPERTYILIIKEAIKLVKADYGSIMLNQDNQLEIVYTSLPLSHGVRPRPRILPYEVFKNRKAIIIDVETDSKIHPTIRKMKIKSIIMIPLLYRNKPFGVMSVDSRKKNKFSKEDLNVMKLFGSLASLAIRKTQLYDEAKKALDSRDLFISMAAHELRTPVTTINGYTQLLFTKLSGSNSPESRWIEELLAEIKRLTFLINELLEVERIKTQKLNYVFHQNSLRDILRRVVYNFRFVHPNHNLIINDNLGKDDLVISDFDKLIQAIDNLLDNAVKFSLEQSSIHLTLDRKGSYFTIKVQDQGIGIKKEDLKTIFEKFNRGSDHSREGMGLGLFLVKNIINQHHGDIKIYSKEKGGTRVELRLPGIKT